MLLLGFTGITQAATVGQWASSGSIWASSGNFSSIYSAATLGAGVTVESPETITSANLANDQFFIVKNPTASLTGAEATALMNWVNSGGILLVFAESASQTDAANNVLSSVHSGVSYTNNYTGSNYFQISGNFNGTDVTAGLSGPMGMYTGLTLNGGKSLVNPGAANWNMDATLRTEGINLGKVYVFGSALDANYNQAGWSNTQFFLALLSQNAGISGGGFTSLDTAPEPATFAFAGLGLAGLIYAKKRKQ